MIGSCRTLQRLPEFVAVLLYQLVLWCSAAQAQAVPATPFELLVPGDSSVLRVDTAVSAVVAPVWCNSRTIAFDNGSNGRFWIEYYTLNSASAPVIVNSSPGSGSLIRCVADSGRELRLHHPVERDPFFGDFVLTVASTGIFRLANRATLLSADAGLRNFTFAAPSEPWTSGQTSALELLEVGLQGDVMRTPIAGGAHDRVALTAKVSSEGALLAYLIGRPGQDREADQSNLEVVVARPDRGLIARAPVHTLLGGSARLKDIHFEQGVLVLEAVDATGHLFLALCDSGNQPFECRSFSTEIASASYQFVGLGEVGPIFATDEARVGETPNSRACLFELAGSFREAPDACRMSGPALPAPPHAGAVALFALSPDRRFAAVRTRFRDASTHGIASEWVIAPMSSFRTH